MTNSNYHSSREGESHENLAVCFFKALFERPQLRRMAATAIGKSDQTCVVTRQINEWLIKGQAQVIGVIRCLRSGRLVESISIDPKQFRKKSRNQLSLFDEN